MADQLEQLKAALAGHYDVERLLGQGGMANVYLAQDPKHQRRVAIKVLKPELSATIGAERFLREIRVAAQLQHPNILGLYDSGDADGLLYYVMPFVEGESLRDRLSREHQLPIEDAVRIVREAAEALHYAHERKIIHRDIKPENILLQGGHALVADFGIARAVESAGQKLTETGMAVGTPHYMSPEQSLGGDMDGRSDEYSLGCVLYELLVGQPPFDGPNAMAVLARHSLEQVPSMQVVRNSVPDAVEDAVFRALEKTPADRYPSMKGFAEALGEAEAEASLLRTSARRANTPRTPQQIPISTRRTTAKIMRPGGTRQTPVQEFQDEVEPRPRRTWLLTGAVVALLVVLGLFGIRYYGARGGAGAVVSAATDESAKHIAVLYFDSPANDSLRLLADGLTEGLIRELTRVQGLYVISANGVAQFRGQDTPPDSIGRILKVGTLVEGSVEQSGSRVRVNVRLVDASSGAPFERASFEQPAGSYLTLADSLSQQAALLLRQRLGVEIRLRQEQQRTRNPQAWVLVQRAEALRKQVDSLARNNPAAATIALDQADSLLGAAVLLDATWPEPLILKGALASRRVRLVNRDPMLAAPILARGLSSVDQALTLAPQNADALYQRGDLRYWRWILGLETDPTAARQLLAAAQSDFEQSKLIDPLQAQAWASLSHLYNQSGNFSEVQFAARRAYEADAYLANIDVVIHRLFLSSYDLADFTAASHWCEEGARRFPTDYRFTLCRLQLLTTRAGQPDVDRAWRLRDSVAALAPRNQREFWTLASQMTVASVLARKQLGDSAKRVIARSRGTPDIDGSRDLLFEEAVAQTALGDKDAAFKALMTYWAANPDRQAGMVENPGWEFQQLTSDPRWGGRAP